MTTPTICSICGGSSRIRATIEVPEADCWDGAFPEASATSERRVIGLCQPCVDRLAAGDDLVVSGMELA